MITFIIGLLIIGLVAGFLARAIVPGRQDIGLVPTILVGIAGSLLFGLILGLLTGGGRANGYGPAGWIGSIIGAIVVLLIYVRVVGNRRRV